MNHVNGVLALSRSRLLHLGQQLQSIIAELTTQTPVVPSGLSTIEKKLLCVARPTPMKSTAFARLANYTNGSHVRQALADLARMGLLAKAAGGGYQL